jgi:hypothetical protein
MKKLIALLFVAFLALGLVACAEDEPSYEYGYGVGYGLVHGHYVGVAKVVLDKDDKVVNVQFEEYYLPYNVGQVAYTPVEGVDQPDDVLTVVGSRGISYFGKYVSVNGVLFTGAVTGESGAQSIVYSAAGITNIETWVETEANAMAYVEAVEAGLVFIANANGTKSAYEFGNASVKRGWTKSATAYWANAASYPLGWGGNMAAIAEAMVGTKLDAVEADLVKDGTTWKIGTIVTGATLSDFVDYYLLAQRAYANALAGKK